MPFVVVHFHCLFCKMGIFWIFHLYRYLMFTTWKIPKQCILICCLMQIYMAGELPSCLPSVVFIALWACNVVDEVFVLQFIFAFTFHSFPFLSLALFICISHSKDLLSWLLASFFFSDVSLLLGVSWGLVVVFDCSSFVIFYLFFGDLAIDGALEGIIWLSAGCCGFYDCWCLQMIYLYFYFCTWHKHFSIR